MKQNTRIMNDSVISRQAQVIIIIIIIVIIILEIWSISRLTYCFTAMINH